MTNWTPFLSDSNLIHALGWTVLHSLWQGCLLAMLLYMALRQLSSPHQRYLASIGAMGVMLVASFTTFGLYFDLGSGADAGVSTSVGTASWFVVDMPHTSPRAIARYLPIICNVWLIGLALFGIRLLLSIIHTQVLRHTAQPVASIDIQQRMQRLAEQMGIRKPIHLLSSTLARTPSMVGHFRPAIILPIAIINQLDTKDVEAILAHELAHIWRHDFVVNLLQSIVDLLYYYHPAIYYISEQARIEREHCCDDMAIQHTGHATDYAKTLVKLQEIKHHTYTPSLAMHMQRSKNAFMNRIFRILSQPINTPRPSSKLAVLALLFALTIGLHEHAISSSNTHVENIASLDPQQLTSPNFSPVSLPMDVDTTPVEKTIIKKKVISIVNGDTIVTETITENDGADRQIIVNGNVFPFADSDIQMFRLDSLGNTMKMITKDVNINVMMDSLNSGMAKIKMFLNNDGKTMNWDSLIPLGEKGNVLFWDSENGELNMDSIFGEFQNFENSYNFEMLREPFMEFNFDSLMQGQNFNFDFDFPESMGDLKIFRYDDLEDMEEMGNLPMGRMHRKPADHLSHELNRDGLLLPNKQNKVELSGKHLKINGDKQPKNIHDKYKRLWQEATGAEMTKKDKVTFLFEGKEFKRRSHRF